MFDFVSYRSDDELKKTSKLYFYYDLQWSSFSYVSVILLKLPINTKAYVYVNNTWTEYFTWQILVSDNAKKLSKPPKTGCGIELYLNL